MRLLASWTDWAHAAGFTSDTVLSTFDASKVAFTERRTGREIGDAILAYIECGRPRVGTLRLFITDRVPIRPITRCTVKGIVRHALIRAGVKSAHQGAHILRHSAATQMLRHGVSLAGGGAVLRHRDQTMTMHYAKVDFALLSEIAQPWAERPAC